MKGKRKQQGHPITLTEEHKDILIRAKFCKIKIKNIIIRIIITSWP
jgi:hypothetical protein